MKEKRGLELSFSMIFSIIVIIAIVAVAFYMIIYLLKLKNCTELGLFTRELQETVDRAWNADSSSELFERTLPSFVDKVCVGSLEQGTNAPEYMELRRFINEETNLFFYPVPRCDISYKKIEHAQFEGFACAPVKNGKVSLKITKGSYDDLVFVCRGDASVCGSAS